MQIVYPTILHDHTLLGPSIEDAWALCVCQPPDCNPFIWQMQSASQVQRQAPHSLRRGLEFASCAGRTFQMPRRLRTADQYSGSGTVPASSCPFMESSSSSSSCRVFPAGCKDNFNICGRCLCMLIEVKPRRWQQLTPPAPAAPAASFLRSLERRTFVLRQAVVNAISETAQKEVPVGQLLQLQRLPPHIACGDQGFDNIASFRTVALIDPMAPTAPAAGALRVYNLLTCMWSRAVNVIWQQRTHSSLGVCKTHPHDISQAVQPPSSAVQRCANPRRGRQVKEGCNCARLPA